MWGRESFIYLTTRAPDVFHSQFACCGRCHSPRIESRILLPLAAASSCFRGPARPENVPVSSTAETTVGWVATAMKYSQHTANCRGP